MGEVEEQMGFLARKKRRKEEEEGKKKLSVPRKYRKVGPESIGVAPPRFPLSIETCFGRESRP